MSGFPVYSLTFTAHRNYNDWDFELKCYIKSLCKGAHNTQLCANGSLGLNLFNWVTLALLSI